MRNLARNMKEKLQVKVMEYSLLTRYGFKELAKTGLCKKRPGIDGILVTVGLCIIALLLCVVMKDSLTTFINTIVTALTTKAQGILQG